LIQSITTVINLIPGVVFAIILWDIIRTDEILERMFIMYLLGCLVVICVEIYTFLQYGETSIIAGNPNYVSTRLVFGIPLAWYIYDQQSSSGYLTYSSVVYIPLSALIVLLTGSRQGFIIFFISMMIISTYYLYQWGGYRSIISSISISSITTVGGAMYYDYSPDIPTIRRSASAVQYILGNNSIEDAGLGIRFDIYSAGLEIFNSNVLFGTGLGSFETAVRSVLGISRTPHSTYLAIGVETGIVGLILFSLMILSLTRNSYKINTENLSAWTLLVIYLTISIVNTWYLEFTVFFIFASILSLVNMGKKSKGSIQMS
jgi:O-antigen ligase